MDLGVFDKEYRQTFVVSQEVYAAFQKSSGDYNPLHTDEGFARGKGFPSCVMYGNILNGFVSYFVGMMLPTQDVIIHKQDIIFKNPVYLDDELEFTARVDYVNEALNVLIFKYLFRRTGGGNVLIAKGNVQIGLL